MPAGTIALTNGSATVTGSGTSFISELKAGDFIYVMVGGAPYTLVASAVGSNTQITLAIAYDGPTSSGLAWVAAPALMQAAITQKILNDFATVARGRILDFQNWQKIYGDAQSVTVTRPDRTTFTGPSWGYMAAQYTSKASSGANKDITSLTGLTTALSVEQGGTGQKSAGLAWKALLDGRTSDTARRDLGLGSVATRNALSSTGDILSEGDYGLGIARHVANFSDTTLLGFGRYLNTTINRPDDYAGCGVQLPIDGAPTTSWLVWNSVGMAYIQKAHIPGGNYTWYKIYTDANTTRASDGTLKTASPVARIVCSKENSQRTDVAESGFTWCGCGTANEEAEGISVKRFDTGIYILTGSAGLASEGWQLLPPRDPQGSGDLGIVEAEETESGGLKINLYKRRYRLNAENGDIEVVKGDLIDVPVNSWIDVRLDMPENSVFKLKQKAMQQAAENADNDAGS